MTCPPHFDVFLCHNSEDKPFIREIARKLRGEKLTPWLDEEQLRGGDVWSEVLNDISQEIKTVAVFVGRNGFGPWQKEEISGFLSACVDLHIRVIPVLLDNAPPGNPELPFFLRGRIWIDFRQSEPDPFELLLRGIRGVKPAPIPETKVTSAAKTFSFEVVTIRNKMAGFLGLQKKITRDLRSAEARYFREDLGNGVTLDMVAIPGGAFVMGSPDSEADRSDSESPQHSVTIAPFHMGKFAVTQAQYQSLMGNNPSHFKGENRPVETVSWRDAIVFCQKLSEKTGNLYRLPSEAEWEYACRAGTTTPFHFGETIATDLANYNGNYTYGQGIKRPYRQETIPVGSFPANAFGLHDMHGNIWEWCEDHWHENYKGVPTDGSAWWNKNEGGKRVLRGGSWFFVPWYCRSASRYSYDAGGRGIDDGFRVVCSAPRT